MHFASNYAFSVMSSPTGHEGWIAESEEPRFISYRHWNLRDAMYHSDYIATRMRDKNSDGGWGAFHDKLTVALCHSACDIPFGVITALTGCVCSAHITFCCPSRITLQSLLVAALIGCSHSRVCLTRCAGKHSLICQRQKERR